jgi:hypothetical protein
MKTWLTVLLLMFIVTLTDGNRVKIPMAMGFVQVVVSGIECIGFFDAKGTPLLAIPSVLVVGAKYVSDDTEL